MICLRIFPSNVLPKSTFPLIEDPQDMYLEHVQIVSTHAGVVKFIYPLAKYKK